MAQAHRRCSRPGATTVTELMNRVASDDDDVPTGDIPVPALVRRETALAKGWSSAGVTHRVSAPSAAVKSKPLTLYAAAVGAAFCGSIASAEPLAEAIFPGGEPGSEVIARLPGMGDGKPSPRATPTQATAVPGDRTEPAVQTSGQAGLASQEGSEPTATPTTAPAPAPAPAPATVPAPSASPSDGGSTPVESHGEGGVSSPDGGEGSPDGGGEQPPEDSSDYPSDPGWDAGRDDSESSRDRSGSDEPADDSDDSTEQRGDRGDGEHEQAARQPAEDGDGERGGRHRAEDRQSEAEQQRAAAETRSGPSEESGPSEDTEDSGAGGQG